MSAKAEALLACINLAKEMGMNRVWIELDSLELVNILQKRSKCPCSQYYTIQSMFKLQHSIEYVITHIFHKGNQMTNGIANEGVELKSDRVYRNIDELPKKTQGALRLDMIGVPYIRV